MVEMWVRSLLRNWVLGGFQAVLYETLLMRLVSLKEFILLYSKKKICFDCSGLAVRWQVLRCMGLAFLSSECGFDTWQKV